MLLGHNHPVSKLKRNQEEESLGVRRLHKKEAGMKAKKDKGGELASLGPTHCHGAMQVSGRFTLPPGLTPELDLGSLQSSFDCGFLTLTTDSPKECQPFYKGDQYPSLCLGLGSNYSTSLPLQLSGQVCPHLLPAHNTEYSL